MKYNLIFDILSEAAERPYLVLAQTLYSHRHPLSSMVFVWGSMWTPCLTGLSSYSSLYLAYRSDRYSHAISHLDRLISSKGDYFPLSAFPHIQYLCPSVLLHPDALIPCCYHLACISSHAVIWTSLIPVILWGALIVTTVSLGFLWVFN